MTRNKSISDVEPLEEEVNHFIHALHNHKYSSALNWANVVYKKGGVISGGYLERFVKLFLKADRVKELLFLFDEINGSRKYVRMCHLVVIDLLRKNYVDDAYSIFLKMKKIDMTVQAPVYYSLINGFIMKRDFQKSLELFDELKKEGIEYSIVVFNTFINGYIEAGMIDQGIKLFESMQREGIRPNEITFSCIIKGFSNTGNMAKVLEYYNKLKQAVAPNAQLFHKMIETSQSIDLIFFVLNEMNIFNVGPLKQTQHFVLQKLDLPYLKENLEFILSEFEKYGISPDTQAYNIIISKYSSESNHTAISEIINEMMRKNIKPNSETYSYIMKSMNEQGNFEESEKLLKSMTKFSTPSEALYTYFIQVLVDQELSDSAIRIFHRKVESIKNINMISFNLLLKHLLSQNKDQEADNLVSFIEKNGGALNVTSYNIILSDFVRKDKDISIILSLFDEMKQAHILPDLHTNTIMITHLLSKNWVDKAHDLYQKMKKARRISPDLVFFRQVILKLSELGMYNDIELIYLDMIQYNVTPDLKLFSIIIESFMNDNNFEKTFYYFKKMRKAKVVPDQVLLIKMIKLCLHKEEFMTIISLLKHAQEIGVYFYGDLYVEIISKFFDHDKKVPAWIVINIFAQSAKSSKYYNRIMKYLYTADESSQLLRVYGVMKSKKITPTQKTYEVVSPVLLKKKQYTEVIYLLEQIFPELPKVTKVSLYQRVLSAIQNNEDEESKNLVAHITVSMQNLGTIQ